MSGDLLFAVAYPLQSEVGTMRIKIGKTRSGRDIEIEVEPTLRVQRFLADYSRPDDRFDALCLVLFLRLREKGGWLLTPLGSEAIFDRLAAAIEFDPKTDEAIAVARDSGASRSAFADLELGRRMALPGLRG
jgi:hypothetical protein